MDKNVHLVLCSANHYQDEPLHMPNGLDVHLSNVFSWNQDQKFQILGNAHNDTRLYCDIENGLHRFRQSQIWIISSGKTDNGSRFYPHATDPNDCLSPSSARKKHHILKTQ